MLGFQRPSSASKVIRLVVVAQTKGRGAKAAKPGQQWCGQQEPRGCRPAEDLSSPQEGEVTSGALHRSMITCPLPPPICEARPPAATAVPGHPAWQALAMVWVTPTTATKGVRDLPWMGKRYQADPTPQRASQDGGGKKHTARTAKQSKAVYHNDGGRQPHHPPQAPAPAQHPTPIVGGRPTTRALHPRTATAAHKRGTRARKNHRQAPGARTRPRQWVGGPVQALRRLPELGPHGRSGPARVAAAAAPHGGSVAHNAEAA